MKLHTKIILTLSMVASVLYLIGSVILLSVALMETAQASTPEITLEESTSTPDRFVTSITSTTSVFGTPMETIRIGTCEAGDPINIQYVNRVVVKTVRVPEERVYDPSPVPAKDGGGDRNYQAVLKY